MHAYRPAHFMQKKGDARKGYLAQHHLFDQVEKTIHISFTNAIMFLLFCLLNICSQSFY